MVVGAAAPCTKTRPLEMTIPSLLIASLVSPSSTMAAPESRRSRARPSASVSTSSPSARRRSSRTVSPRVVTPAWTGDRSATVATSSASMGLGAAGWTKIATTPSARNATTIAMSSVGRLPWPT